MDRENELIHMNGPSNDETPQGHVVQETESVLSAKEIMLQHITATIQICSILFTTLIVLLCFTGEIVLFTWHPLLLSIGWAFYMTQAVLVVPQENFLFGTLTRSLRIKIHWIIQILSMVFIITGFIVVIINKNNLNKEHFQTWHALFGLIGIVCSILTSVGGIFALYSATLRHYIKPKYLKGCHTLAGGLTVIFGGMALFLSTFTKWFEKNTNNNRMVFVVACITTVMILLWTSLRPLLRSYNYFK